MASVSVAERYFMSDNSILDCLDNFDFETVIETVETTVDNAHFGLVGHHFNPEPAVQVAGILSQVKQEEKNHPIKRPDEEGFFLGQNPLSSFPSPAILSTSCKRNFAAKKPAKIRMMEVGPEEETAPEPVAVANRRRDQAIIDAAGSFLDSLLPDSDLFAPEMDLDDAPPAQLIIDLGRGEEKPPRSHEDDGLNHLSKFSCCAFLTMPLFTHLR